MQELLQEAAQQLGGDLASEASQFAERDPADHSRETESALALFEQAGRDHFRRDRPLRSLLRAYHAGGTVAWRHIAALAVREGLPAEALAALAEAVFRAVDRMGGLTTNGYQREQSESAGMREQARAALAEQLLAGSSDRAALESLAQQAGWPLPAEAAVILIRCDDDTGPTALARLATRCLQIHSWELPGMIVPDPGAPGARHRLSTLLRGCPALVGPALPLSQLPDGAAVARDALWLLDLPMPQPPPFFVDEHLDEIIVHRDERLLNALRSRCLAPLESAARGNRAAYRDTLRSWLVHLGDRGAVAAQLQVHPQTVRYRLARLHELFGPALDDPRERLRLFLAVAWDGPGTPAGPARESGAEQSHPGAAASASRSKASATVAASRAPASPCRRAPGPPTAGGRHAAATAGRSGRR